MSSIESNPEPLPFQESWSLLQRFEAAAKARRDAELECARVLELLDSRHGWRSVGCASVGELGERSGMAAYEARALLDLGRAIKVSPLLEQQVREGRITVAAAACVGPVLADPALLRDEDDWIGWAQTEPTKALRRRVRQRVEEVRLGGEATVPVNLFVRASSRDDLDRARAIASQKASRALTPGETFETVVDHYLDTFDVERVTPGTRRCPPTAMVDGRYVPMAVRREIYERQGQACAVPLCEHTMFLEMAHLVAHASGGDREADNLVLLCNLHHLFLDQGTLRMEGTAAKPKFFDSRGRDFSRRYEPGGAFSWNPAFSRDPAEALRDELGRAPPDPGGPVEQPGANATNPERTEAVDPPP